MTHDNFDWDELQGLSDSTKRAYHSFFSQFNGDVSSVEDVLAHMFVLTEGAASASSINTFLSSVNKVADWREVPSAARSPRVKDQFAAIKRNTDQTVSKKAPLRHGMIIKATPELKVQEEAVLQFGLATGLRRSELAAIRQVDLQSSQLNVPLAKTGSRTVMVPTRVLDGLSEYRWMYAKQLAESQWLWPHNGIVTEHIPGEWISRLVKRVAALSGENPDLYGGHSLRSGYVTACLENGVPEWKIIQQTGHKNTTQLHAYARWVGSEIPDII